MDTGNTTRILVDTWFSRYAIGDLMERVHHIEIDPHAFASIDIVYISHAHCDHLDPYTLCEIFRYSQPLLVLPYTIAYLEPLFQKYLPLGSVHILFPGEMVALHGIEITGHMWANPEITNEDDVMMISFANKTELLFAEIDTEPDMLDDRVQRSLMKVFTRRNYETRCYLATRNCLEGQIPYYDLPEDTISQVRENFIRTQKEDIVFQYEKFEYEEYAHLPNLFLLDGFVRGYI
jgi:hypothetical protein